MSHDVVHQIVSFPSSYVFRFLFHFFLFFFYLFQQILSPINYYIPFRHLLDDPFFFLCAYFRSLFCLSANPSFCFYALNISRFKSHALLTSDNSYSTSCSFSKWMKEAKGRCYIFSNFIFLRRFYLLSFCFVFLFSSYILSFIDVFLFAFIFDPTFSLLQYFSCVQP